MFRRVHQGPQTSSYLNSNPLSRNPVVSSIPPTISLGKVNRLTWYDTIARWRGEFHPLSNLSFSLEDNKKIRWNYLISGPASNEITAQSWGVEFQLQLWSQAETRWSVRSINPSISDTLSQISYWSATKNIERARAFSRTDVTCDAPLSKVEFVSKVRRACPDNWTGWKELAGWTEAKE